jgi:hypothetical protein
MKTKFFIRALLATIIITGCRDSKPQQEPIVSPVPSEPIPQQIATPERTPIPSGAIEEGHKVFERIKSKYSKAEISIWGAGTSTPKVALWIPESEWNNLSNMERGNLGYYVKSSVSVMRSNPGPHIGISSSAPIYTQFVSNCRSMSEDSWIIGVGSFNAAGSLLLDHEAASGAQSPWHTNEAIPTPSSSKSAPTTETTATTTTWTSSDGRTIQAAMLRLEGEIVILQRNDGQIFKVPLVNLSPESQTAAKKVRN